LSAAQAQTPSTPAQNPNDAASTDKSSRKSDARPLGTPEDEMMARQELKAAEKEYHENIERAREAAQLSTEIRASFLQNKDLGRTELKKLERLEKITRKIRSEAGGSDSEVTIENPPTQIEPALSRLAEMAEKVRKVVEKTPRQVVSASVIEEANQMLEILRLIRGLTR
jgi:ribosome-binding protein aMBF1 (putative translation factor)